MGDDAFHDLTASYALDALESDEARAYEEHLARCASCQDELASLQAAAGALAYGAGAAQPPDSLRDRILDAAHAERSNVTPVRPRWSRPSPIAMVSAFAAVAACAVIGLAVWDVSLHDQLGNTQVALRGAPLSGANGTVVYSGGRGALVVSGLAPAPMGKTYEAWVIQSGRAYAAGLFPGGGRTIVVRLTRALPAGAVVAVTLERAGGVTQPTHKPLITSSPV